MEHKNFHIIAIGASAGGLPALESFFKAMPKAPLPPMAFVVIQHLSPDYKSILSKLIQKFTSLTVIEVTEGLEVLPNNVYVIPENSNMTYHNGLLHLHNPTEALGNKKTIDNFIFSLSKEIMDNAVAIILSGAGSDGTQGLHALKMNGGMVMVQKPETAQFSGMPSSAIASGYADFCLPPEELPNQLINFINHITKKNQALDPKGNSQQDEIYQVIFSLLQLRTGHDFSTYKPNTIIRRAQRRMALHKIENVQQYALFLEQNSSEVFSLFQDLLIGVTNFFRDPEAFLALEEKVIPKLFQNKTAGETIRLWSVGCSTGEEAYSICILLQEYMEKAKINFKILFFATDLNHNAIDQARTGLFKSSIVDHISPERLTRFFTLEQDSGHYRINRSLRNMLIFSEQNVTKDPPFSKIDFVSCRNLLIYMGAELQRKTIAQFHYALKPGGFLFLGSSETTGDFAHGFITLDRKLKIYQRIESFTAAYKPDIKRITRSESQFPSEKISTGKINPMNTVNPKKMPLRELTEKTLLHFSPASALINDKFEVLYLHGKTGLYLEHSTGEASMNIIKMAKDGLKRDLTSALYQVQATGETICKSGVKVDPSETNLTINLTITSVIKTDLDVPTSKLYLVTFQEVQAITSDGEGIQNTSIQSKIDSEKILSLEQELREKEEFLHTTRDELQSSNQEMQSNNEELQSTNEELETSKEELQSVNEELATINAELQSKVIDLSHANNDMNNLLMGTGIGTIFVDHNKTIVRFTPTASKLINLIQSDIGRPIGHIVTNFKTYSSLLKDIKSVLDDLIPTEIEVQTKNEDWYLMRIRPYRTIENVIEGAVITFFDISQIKKIQLELDKSNALGRLAIIALDSVDAIIVQDLNGKILAWNPGAEKMYAYSEAEAQGMNINDIILESERAKEKEIIKRLSFAEKLEPYAAKRISKDEKIIEVTLTATALVDTNQKIYAIATTERRMGQK